MTVKTISSIVFVPSFDSNTPGVTLASGDTLNLLAIGGIIDIGSVISPGVSGAGANSVVLNGNVLSTGSDGLVFAAGNNTISVLAGSSVSGANGINILNPGGSNAVTIAGK